MSKKALGRGLNALLNTSENENEAIRDVDILSIQPDQNQPRKMFEEKALTELAESIQRNGVIQPIIVKENKPDTYTIIAGERRWRASRIAGLKSIPVIVKNLTDIQRIEISLIENLQREDLNPIEEAMAYVRLQQEFQKTQEEISEIVGKSRSAITNTMRLLQLDPNIQESIVMGLISSGHA